MAPPTTPLKAVPAGTAPTPLPAEGSLAAPATPQQRMLLRAALALAGTWWLGLAALCLFTANPALVSREQLAQSEFVVSVLLPDVNEDEVTVERSWRGELKRGKIRVINLSDADRRGIAPHSEVILPLNAYGSDYRITTLVGQSAAALIYPATTQVLDQIQALPQRP